MGTDEIEKLMKLNGWKREVSFPWLGMIPPSVLVESEFEYRRPKRVNGECGKHEKHGKLGGPCRKCVYSGNVIDQSGRIS